MRIAGAVWVNSPAYLFCGFKHRHSIGDPVGQSPRSLSAVDLLKLLCQLLDLVDVSRLVVPSRVLSVPATLAVDPESRIVLTLDEEVSSLVAVEPPRLHRQRLVLVVVVSLLLVLLLEHPLHGLGAGQRPHDERAEEVELEIPISGRFHDVDIA